MLHYASVDLGTNPIAGEHSIIESTGDFAATISFSTEEESLYACRYEEKYDFCDPKYEEWLAISHSKVIKEPTKRKADSEVQPSWKSQKIDLDKSIESYVCCVCFGSYDDLNTTMELLQCKCDR